MSELRVPTRAVPARVTCADGREFQGRVFVPEQAERHDGAMRVIDVLNDRNAFFPFLPDGGEPPFLINKREILVLTVSGGADRTSPADDEALPTVTRRVVLEAGSWRLEGHMHIEMPESHSRVLDWVNRTESFIVVELEGDHHLVQKERIARIIELRGE